MADVLVRRGHGQAMVIGPPPAGPAGVAIVGLVGGDVHVDPAAPDEPLHTVVHDPDEAGPAVAALYGPAVAAAVRAAGPEPVRVEAGDGRFAADVRRAAVARWLATHSPDQLPEPLLDLEIGVAGSRSELAPEVVEDAAERLRRRAGLIVRMSRRLREPDAGRPPSGLPELVADAVQAAVEVVDIGTAEHDELEHERDLAAALRHLDLPSAALSWADLAALPQVSDRSPQPATYAGSRRTDPAAQQLRASVDWFQVPRGVLATVENTVLATVAGPRVEVTVLAAPGAPDYPRLAFRIYAVGRPLPLARGALRRSADGSRFTGVAQLPAFGPREGLSVDVYDAGDPRPPRLGVNARAARAERWAARAVSLVRLGGGAESDSLAAAAFGEAGTWYAEVVGRHTDQAHRDRALRRQARCAALRRAALVRVGQPRQAAEIGRRWAAGAVVTEADVAVPDLGSPGWRPLAVERALSADPRWWR